MKVPDVPLSPQQRQLWRQISQCGAAPFRTRCEVRIEGPLDEARLRASLDDRIVRHESLRDPAAVVTGLERLGPDLHRLDLEVSALVADARGLESLVLEMARTYEALGQGGDVPGVAMQLGVLARWQNEILESEEAGLGRQLWARQDLSSLMVRLPWEAAGSSFDPRAVPVELAPEVAERLARMVPGASAADVLQSCWQVLLWRLAGGSGMVVGAAFSGRAYGEVEEAVGPFAKDLPVSVRLDRGMPFSAVARSIAEARTEARDWQEYFTWDQIQQAVGDAGSLFFPCAFEDRSLPPPFAAGGLRFRIQSSAGCHDRFLVRLRTLEAAGGARTLELLYDASALSEGDASALAGQLATVIATAVETPGCAVGDLPLVGSTERRLLLDLAVAPPAPGASPFPRRGALQAFEEQAARQPERTAAVAGEAVLTYGALDARANRIARYLRSLGLKQGDLVGALLGRSALMPAAIMGILKAGAAYMPLDPAYPMERLEIMVRDSRIRWLVAEEAPDERLRPADARLVLLDREVEAIAQQAQEPPGLDLTPESPAYLMYTSGSTGEPRGVVVTHGNLAHYVQALQLRVGLQPEDRCLHTASVAFSSSARQLFVPLSHGAAVVVASTGQRADAEALFREVRDRGVTVVDLVPSAWRGYHRSLQALSLQARAALLDNRLRLGLSASEPLPGDLPALWSAATGGRLRLINMYGQTETTGIVATFPVPEGEGAGAVVPLGRPLPGTAIHLLDSCGDLAALGFPGELCIGGPGVGQGYLGRPAETAERFVPDPFGAPGARLYRTGDLGRRRSDGTLEFLGRGDHQIKVRGIRIEPGEVEIALTRHEAVREAAVLLHREEGTGRERLVAYVVPQGALPGPEELRGFLLRTLPHPMVPAVFVALEALPRMPNGKLDRRSLPAPGRENGSAAYVAPRDEVERALAGIWQEVLSLEQVSVQESFFALGGHSLLASLAVSRVREAFAVELPVVALFRAPTVAGLAREVREALEQSRATASLGRIVPLAEPGGEEELPDDLDGLSDEQVSALLARLAREEAP